MKRFLTRIGVFVILSFVVLNGIGWLLIETENQGHAVENSRIYLCLKKARINWPDSDVFIFGDSVANQMYPPETTNGRINSLALVMPSTLAGQYFLLKRLAETNDLRGKTVVLILSPEGFAGDFSHPSTYHYVLKPFHHNEFRPWEDSHYRSRVQQTFITDLSQLPILKCSNWNPPSWMPYLNEAALKPSDGLSPFAEHYLRKMEVLAMSAGVDLRVMPTIQPEAERGTNYDRLKESIWQCGLDGLFDEYFGAFQYLPDGEFRDGAHVRNREILGDNILGL